MGTKDTETLPLLANGLESAFLGSVYSTALGVELAVYDIDKCIAIFENDGMTHEEAVEYFYFNVACAHVGITTPLFLQTQTLADFDNSFSE